MEPQQPPIDTLQGSVILKVQEGRLERNLHAFIKMDPYCVGLVGSTQIKGQVCKNGGLLPAWTDAIVLQLRNDLPCFLEVKDRQMLTGDSIIGVCEIDLQTLFEEKTVTRWYDLYYMKRLAGKILVDATYTEQNYGSRNIIYTKLKPVKPTPPQDQTPVSTKMAQKHLPGPQDHINQESMRGSVGSKLSGSPNKGGSAQKEQLRNSPGQQISQENQGTEGVTANNGVAGETVAAVPVTQTEAQPTTTHHKRKKGWKLMRSIKKMFGAEDGKKKKEEQLQQNNMIATTGETPENLVPLRRRKLEGPDAPLASTGTVPVNPNQGIVERPTEPAAPKPSLKDYLEKENLSAQMNRPVQESIRNTSDKGLSRVAQPVVYQDGDRLKDQYRSVGYQDNDRLKDQYRSVGQQQIEETKKPVRLSDMLSQGAMGFPGQGFQGQGQGPEGIDKMTPDWKSNTGVQQGGFFGQPQEVNSLSVGAGQFQRRLDEASNVPLYKYR